MADSEDLVLDKLASGDRPSVYAAGMVVAQALKETGTAVLMTDVLGRVHVLPKEFVEVKRRPRLSDDELDALTEDEAIRLLVKQDDVEDVILSYLKRRAGKGI
jgi:hypothetical protein